MVSRRAGHFVQVWKPIGPRPHRYVNVEGRVIQQTVSEYPFYAPDGWFYVSRELDKRRAKHYARAYRCAGFKTRIVLHENSGKTTVVM